jgi:phosphoglycerol transferase MdoB-like AlkP superfamily enzyme
VSDRSPISTKRRLVSVAVAFVFSLLWAAACTAAIDRIQAANNAGRALARPIEVTSELFLISALLVWVVMLALIALTGRVVLSAGLLMVVSLGLGFADYEKLQMRSEPVYPSDLQFLSQPGFLTDMVGVRPVVLTTVAFVVCLGVFAAAGWLLGKVFPRIRRSSEPRTWVAWVVSRVVVLVAASLVLVYAAHFNSPGNKVREAYVASGADWVKWNQRINYMRHGFVAGLLYNTTAPAMTKPAGYSKSTMDALAARYSTIADQMNQGRSPGALDGVNIVVILSESFSDPTKVSGIHLQQDPLPFTRKLMTRTESGNMLSLFIGGGTADMEFEALTGFSLAEFLPQLNTPYQQLVTKTKTFPSVVGYLKGKGHDAVAIHPFVPTMYNRLQAYPTLGFSHFIHQGMLQEENHIERNHYISDASAFHEVQYQIDRSAKPLLVNLVTMQNHYPVANKYDHPIKVTGNTQGIKGQLDQYARGVRYSDQAMRQFLAQLKQSPEKTAVVFYGDHAPPLWPRAAIYNKNQATLRKTPFFLWTNFEHLPHHRLPAATSPTHFMPLLFDALHAPLPPYYALLDRLYRYVPAMSPGEYHGTDGRVVDPSRLSPEARQVLHDYRLVQYDLAVGKRYSEPTMFPQAR